MSHEAVHKSTASARRLCDSLLQEIQRLMDAAVDSGLNGVADNYGRIYNNVHTIRGLCEAANTANVTMAMGIPEELTGGGDNGAQ